MLGTRRPTRDHDLLHHHRRAPLAGRNNFQNGKGRPRLGPVPGQDIRRDLPGHRADRPRPAADRCHPGRARRADVLPAAPPAGHNAPAAVSDPAASAADLQFYTGTAPLPAWGGQPCPPGIAPVGLSAAETARIERLARDWKARLTSLARLAFCLRWSAWRRRHQARARWHHYSTRLAAFAA